MPRARDGAECSNFKAFSGEVNTKNGAFSPPDGPTIQETGSSGRVILPDGSTDVPKRADRTSFTQERYRVTGLFAALIFPAVLALQPAQTNTISLTAVRQLKCAFPISVAASWKNGEPQSEVRTEGVLTFEIDQVDVSDGSAQFLGVGAPPAHIIAQISGPNLYFLDIRPNGSLAITTVFAQESRQEKLKAVYMRTDFLSVAVPG